MYLSQYFFIQAHQVARCHILDLLQNQDKLKPEELQAAVDAFQVTFEAAGWSKTAKKKFHWLQHFSDELKRFGFLPNCFCPERKNKIVKHLADNLLNTTIFDSTILYEILAHDLHVLKTPGLFDMSCKLVTPRTATKETLKFLQLAFGGGVDANRANCQQSIQAQLSSTMKCKAGDVALLDLGNSTLAAGEVLLFVAVHDEAFAVVAEWELESYTLHLLRATWRILDTVKILPLQQVLASLTYTLCKDSRAMTLIPFPFRSVSPAH